MDRALLEDLAKFRQGLKRYTELTGKASSRSNEEEVERQDLHASLVRATGRLRPKVERFMGKLEMRQLGRTHDVWRNALAPSGYADVQIEFLHGLIDFITETEGRIEAEKASAGISWVERTSPVYWAIWLRERFRLLQRYRLLSLLSRVPRFGWAAIVGLGVILGIAVSLKQLGPW